MNTDGDKSITEATSESSAGLGAAGAVMPCGAFVTNVHEAYQAGIVHACKMLDRHQRRTHQDLFDEGYVDMIRIVEFER